MTSSPTDGSSSLDSSQAPSIAGKWLIMGILATALAMASFGWWFRFQATHQTAQFWGPEAAFLIRDAPQVFAYRWPEGITVEDWASGSQLASGDAVKFEIAGAPGITHLRTALLEDRSFEWTGPTTEPTNEPLTSLGYGLQFVDSSQHSSQNGSQNTELRLAFSEDCRTLVRIVANGEPSVQISSEPISAGLKIVFGEVFSEESSDPPPVAGESSR